MNHVILNVLTLTTVHVLTHMTVHGTYHVLLHVTGHVFNNNIQGIHELSREYPSAIPGKSFSSLQDIVIIACMRAFNNTVGKTVVCPEYVMIVFILAARRELL
jgi:hypothetical protein